jgi:hypothetical protein
VLFCFVLAAHIGGLDACSDDSSAGDTGDGGVDATTTDAHPSDGTLVDGDLFDGANPDGTAPQCSRHYFEDIEIPMSDGKYLAAFVRRAENPACALPTILIQTPYNKEHTRDLWFDGDIADNPLFSSPSYNFVVLDWRGFYGSAAAAVTQPDYGQDGYDAVEWIATQDWSNGRVATWGVSALCKIQYQTAVKQPPHLVAAVPIFCGMNNTYEDYYPGGVLRREYTDTITALFGANVVEQHPYKDMAWSYLGSLYSAANVAVPMLVVAGWFDLNTHASVTDFADLTTQSPPAVAQAHRLLVGAWHHFAAGGESAAGRPMTAQELLYHDGERKIQQDSLAWFNHHLRQHENEVDQWSPVRYVSAGDGTNVYRSADSWPPAATTEHILYLHATGELSDASPTAAQVSFPYDPLDPSPTKGGATLSPNLDHGPHDQAEVIARDDALVFTSALLSAPLEIHGTLRLELDVATTGVDTDFSVRLTDVDPDENHLLIGEGIARLKLRDSLSLPSTVVAGMRYTLTVDVINDLAYTFAVGHRVGLIITSSNHPRFDRNPNTGNDFFDQAVVPLAVTNTLYTDGSCRLILPVD